MIAAIVLAAGRASRFGAQKLLMPLRESTTVVRASVQHLLESMVDDVVVVLGREGEAVRASLDGLAVRFVDNPRFAEGMSTSVRAGVAALDARTRALVIALGDQPTVSPNVIDALIGAWRLKAAAIVVPVYDGVRGNPVLFDASMIPELLEVEGDRGARDVIARMPERVHRVEIPFPAPPDIDTPEDYDRVIH